MNANAFLGILVIALFISLDFLVFKFMRTKFGGKGLLPYLFKRWKEKRTAG